MRRVLLFFAAFRAINCYCPSGFELVRDGECRGLYEKLTLVDNVATQTAIAKCQEINALPIIIHDEEHANYWKNTPATADRRLLGLTCNTSSLAWQWADGSAMDYKPIAFSANGGATLNGNCREGCAWFMNNTGSWIGWCDTDNEAFDIFCTTQLPPAPAPEGGCSGFEDDSDDGICYQVGATAENWQEARQICRSFGGEVASIHSLKENSFVRRLAVSKGALSGMFLGATISGKGNDFTWTDGSEWNYDNFAPGFPVSGLGDCLAMDPQVASGQWVNADCSSKFSVACEMQENFTIPDYCPSGPWKEGQVIYSPGFPYNASVPCDFILTVEAGKNVEAEILLLEANSCCDQLELFDNYIGGAVIANLTGEVNDKTYTTNSSNYMRVSWRPNGGVNVRGMMMTFRGV